MAKVGTG